MPGDDSDLDDLFDSAGSLPQPVWERIAPWVEQQPGEDERFELCTRISRRWLTLMGAAIDPLYEVDESDNFLVLSAQTHVANSALLRTAERCRARLFDLLPGIADFSAPGKLAILVLYGDDTYYAHVDNYHPEGEYGASAGMCIRGDWPHIVALDGEATSLHKTLTHELTHAALNHLTLPQWIEEGLAQIAEGDVTGEGLSFDYRRVRLQKEHWRSLGLSQFWSGEAFSRPDESQEFGYQLAEILVRLLLDDFQPRWFGFDQRPLESLIKFLRTASAGDAGQAAAIACLGMSLGELAAKSLGPGDWEPEEEYPHGDLEG